ncbi:MAG TPA: N-acetyl-gamma-glutamyl-phosphate reductase [bacterium]|nr:N-acetyl-gamma-glutamyl-phosphate reductase [bacterium]HPO81521.1 N-acetyl-gamma-glutamyl-phosphate reductase [bacterium]HRU31833.1 N-acetyl-gamma-glutamyl-phosphate reductase [bacterium]
MGITIELFCQKAREEALINVAIWGATGYTGVELFRILTNHPEVKIRFVFSHTYSGESLSVIYPYLERFEPIALTNEEEFNRIRDKDFDVAFLALPAGVSAERTNLLIHSGKKVIDIGSDFRLKNLDDYKKWYNFEHMYPDLVSEAVYGIPELNRNEIKSARIVANPGCYPTSFLLGVAPILKNDLLEGNWLYVDSKSGTSGAGKKSSVDMSFSEMFENIRPYNVGKHRHIPEMEQEAGIMAKRPVKVAFTPQLAPISRGILTTIYAHLKEKVSVEDLYSMYGEFYKDSYFVRVLPVGSFPATKGVRGSNFCDIGLAVEDEVAIITTAIDNLVKGAGGQAVQNMNIMFGLKENLGLDIVPLYP